MKNPIAFIDSVKWKFAHTMPWIPHWYIVKDNLRSVKGKDVVVDRTLYDELAEHIRTYGRVGLWGINRVNTYLSINGHPWYYWTGDTPLAESTIINRAKIETDSVRYLDKLQRVSPTEHEGLDRWCDSTECPECRTLDPIAQQWAGDVLVGLICSSCRRRYL